ncbi:MAG: UDP-N-acetylmuramoyl-L-alanine--D-glutamate ligase [Patescibacteria group bacterium]|nr:UDP-N-acetylmuramoyl-L-alanine--D-glutamate ligase [Patescibacteria group bacterium]
MINHFKDKKITIIGLGLLGRGLGYTKFLAEQGADLIVTDLKDEKILKNSVKELKKYKNIEFVLGKHRLKDFRNRDMIIKNPSVPVNSIYLKEAKKNKIPIEMDVSLFMKLAPEITLVGITGTRGKSVTTSLVYEILKDNLKKKVYLGGNIRGVATLPLLKRIKEGDILVAELDSWQLKGFGQSKISPNIAVFTTFMPDHLDYYQNNLNKYFKDKANIFKYQKKEDVLIILSEVKKLIPKNVKSKLIVAKKLRWNFKIPGEHQLKNLSCAVEVAKQFKIKVADIKKTLKKFKGMEGRLQYLKSIKGVKIYNDNNATTPEASIAGMKSFNGNVILIAGGADKNLKLDDLIKEMKKCKEVVLIPGSGTERLVKKYNKNIEKDLESAVKKAISISKKGDVVLFSPGFASFGVYNNEYERNDEFISIIKKL